MGVPDPPLPKAAALDGGVYYNPTAAAAGGGMQLQPGLNNNNGVWPVGAPPLGGLPLPTPLDVMADTATNLGAPQVLAAVLHLLFLRAVAISLPVQK